MNINVLSQYVKDLKTTSLESYVYTSRDDFFGDIIYSYNTCYLSFMNLNIISDDYLNKMFSIKCIKDEIPGYELWFGILEQPMYTYTYVCRQWQKQSINMIKDFKKDIQNATFIHKITNLNENEAFYNDILCRKSDEGAGRFVISNVTGMTDKVLYIAPCMLPGSKSTPLDMVIYDIDECGYFVVAFITHKKTGDVTTLMRFLNV